MARRPVKNKPPANDGAAARREGLGHLRAGRAGEAESAFRRVLGARPGDAGTLVDLGVALQAQGRHGDAMGCLRRALEIDPGRAEAHNNLGQSLLSTGRAEEAVACFRAAIGARPGYARAQGNLGRAFRRLGRLEEAAACHRRALEMEPGRADERVDLGLVHADAGRPEEAAQEYQRVLDGHPDHARAHSMLGNALMKLGRLKEARAHHERAVAADPGYVMGHVNKGLADLLAGDYEEGFAEFEWRWRTTAFMWARPDFGKPRWDGGPLGGRTILLHDEQGFGDAIQFVRYAPLVKARSGRVIVDCRGELKRLFKAVDAVDGVVARGEARPPFDVHAPLMSLPGILGTTVASIPAAIPYLAPPDGPREIPGGEGKRRVGVAWAGSPTHRNDRNRSIPPAAFVPLALRDDVALWSLQAGARGRELQDEGPADRITDLGGTLHDFAATAAAIAGLDLVISADTSVAHLAGALAKPVWILLPFAPDWRWLTERRDSPWYPTARLFRQPSPGDWGAVLAEVGEALDAL